MVNNSTEVRRIKYTGKNLNDVFALPYVKAIKKYCWPNEQPYLVLDQNMVVGDYSVTPPGSELVEYSNGKWKILYEQHK